MDTDYPPDAVPAAVAAKRIGCHRSCIHRWVKAGHLRGWLVGCGTSGRRLYVSLAAVLARAIEPITPTGQDGRSRGAGYGGRVRPARLAPEEEAAIRRAGIWDKLGWDGPEAEVNKEPTPPPAGKKRRA